MSSIEEDDLRKYLKNLYDDLLDAEKTREKDPSGFKNKLQVLYVNLQDIENRICIAFGLGDFGVLNNFAPEYLRLGDSGVYQILKSKIKSLAVEIGLDFDQDNVSRKNSIKDGPVVVPTSFQEMGNGISAGSFHTEMKDGFAILKISNISNHSLFDIQDIKAVVSFFNNDGNRMCNVSSILPLMKSGQNDGILILTSTVSGIPSEVKGGFVSASVVDPSQSNTSSTKSESWDFFICHASENKETVARPLYNELEKNDLQCWFDEFSLIWGDSLMKKINHGLSNSSYGIVIFSKEFFEKNWANKELEALFNLAWSGENKILPLRYNISQEEITKRYPLLSGIVSRSWEAELPQIVKDAKTLVSRKRSMKITEPMVEKSINAVVNTTMHIELSDDKVWLWGVVNPNENILQNGPSLQTIKPDGSGGIVTAASNAFEWDGSNYKTFVWLSNFRDVKDPSIFKLWSGNGSKGTILIEKTALISS